MAWGALSAAQVRPHPLAEVGRPGVVQYGGWMREDYLQELNGQPGTQTYREIADGCSVVAAYLWVIEVLARQVSWHVDPASSDPRARSEAEFLDECLTDLDDPLDLAISHLLSAVIYGYSLAEICYKLRCGESDDPLVASRYTDRRYGWRSFAPRAAESVLRWEFDPLGRVLGVHQMPPPDYRVRFLPIEKLLHVVPRAWKGSPEGKSLFRGAVTDWNGLTRTKEIELVGIARDLAGIPVGTVPVECFDNNATADQKNLLETMKQIVTRVERNEFAGLVIPSEKNSMGMDTGITVKLLTSGGSRQIDTDTIIKRYESRILIVLLAELLMLGADNHGSYALADSKTNVLTMSVGLLLDVITEALNRQAIPRLMRLNGVPRDFWPRLVHGDIETPDLTQLGSFVAQTAGAGVLDTASMSVRDAVAQIFRSASGAQVGGGSERRVAEAAPVAPATVAPVG